jgi:hypothetical protein
MLAIKLKHHPWHVEVPCLACGSTMLGIRKHHAWHVAGPCLTCGSTKLGMWKHRACHKSEDGDRTDGDVAGGAEEAVDEPAHEGRVEAVFRLQARQPSVCYSLGT